MNEIHVGALYWTKWVCSYVLAEHRSKSQTLDKADFNRAFYDIGFHEGLFAAEILHLGVPIYGWDADPHKVKKLREQVDFPVFSMGLSNAQGRARLFRYSDDSFNTLFKRDTYDLDRYSLNEFSYIDVVLDTLEHCVETESLLPPFCIKIDVEGAELPALQGGASLLKKYLPIIVFEQSYENTKNAGYTREELRGYIEQFGYLLFGIERDNIDTLTYRVKDRSTWNIIAVHESNEALCKKLHARIE